MQSLERPVQKDRAEIAQERFVSNFHLLQVRKLTCKNHPTADAVSICLRCGYGTCKACTVSLGLKRYCKPDAERVLMRARKATRANRRGPAIGAASFLSWIGGAVGMVLGFALMFLGFVAPSMQQGSGSYSLWAPTLSGFSSVFASFSAGTLVEAGALAFTFGILSVGAGVYLWKRSRVAGLVALTAAIGAALVGGADVAVLAFTGVLLYAWIGVSVAEAAGVILGWSHLR